MQKLDCLIKSLSDDTSQIVSYESKPGDEVKEIISPFSTNAFYKRCSTFSIEKWFGAPKYLSPINCAKSGWSLANCNSLSCSECGSLLNLSTMNCPEKTEDQWNETLKSNHKRDCLWRVIETNEDSLTYAISEQKTLERMMLFLTHSSEIQWSQIDSNDCVSAITDKWVLAALAKLKAENYWLGYYHDDLLKKALFCSICGWTWISGEAKFLYLFFFYFNTFLNPQLSKLHKVNYIKQV